MIPLRCLVATLFVGLFPCLGALAEDEPVAPALRRSPFAIDEADTRWWSFQPVRRPAVPAGTHPIDALVQQHLRARNLSPSPPAAPREQVRRLFYDVLGLPPSHAEISLFEQDPSPEAWARLVDRLLARPEFGERWARHWLDLVRYAETNGYERDGTKPEAWRYRDYVVQSFNRDKPYDRFLIEQLAGDELPGFSAEAIIATGFYRLHVWDDEPDSTLVAEFDDLDDIMVTTSATFLGLTLGCARCHDHKFDPFSQADYYRMLAYFRSIQPYGLHHTGGGGRGTGRITRPLAPAEEFGKWELARIERVRSLRDQLAQATGDGRRRELQQEIQRNEKLAHPFPVALAVHEDPIKPTHILRRGDVLTPGAEVQPGVPEILRVPAPPIVPPENHPATSGRRMTLARWITDRSHPLTARVLVNRIWQHHFGIGLVPTPNDFGRTGLRPTHPEILDWLADELVEGGWRMKRIHRLILTSDAYRQSSRTHRPEALAVDEGNAHLWRQNPRRLEGEPLRDSLLAVAGTLNQHSGGPSFFPHLPKEVHNTQDAAGKGWGESPPAEQDRRSLYVFAKRALTLPLLEAFDCPASTVPVGARSVTTVAPQSLMLLNDAFVQQQARRLVQNLTRDGIPDDAVFIARAFRVVLQREPSPTETQSSLDMLARQRALASTLAPKDREQAARIRFTAALFNLNEFLHVD
jgi:hypothetical protein